MIRSPGFAPLRNSGPAGGRLPDRRDADHQRSVPTIGIAAGDGHAIALRHFGQPFEQIDRQLPATAARQRDGNDHSHRPGRHRCQIAETYRQRLPSNAPRRDILQFEIDALGQQIDRHNAIGSIAKPKNGRIVARTEQQLRMRRHPLSKPSDKVGFHGNGDRVRG